MCVWVPGRSVEEQLFCLLIYACMYDIHYEHTLLHDYEILYDHQLKY